MYIDEDHISSNNKERINELGKELRSTMEFAIHDKDIFELRDCLRKNIEKQDILFSVHIIRKNSNHEIQYDKKEVTMYPYT